MGILFSSTQRDFRILNIFSFPYLAVRHEVQGPGLGSVIVVSHLLHTEVVQQGKRDGPLAEKCGPDQLGVAVECSGRGPGVLSLVLLTKLLVQKYGLALGSRPVHVVARLCGNTLCGNAHVARFVR